MIGNLTNLTITAMYNDAPVVVVVPKESTELLLTFIADVSKNGNLNLVRLNPDTYSLGKLDPLKKKEK